MATNNIINSRLMVATKTAAQWAGYTVVPLKGELCFESDTLRFKLGNAVDSYDALPYVDSAGITAVAIDGATVFTATRDAGVLDVKGGNHVSVAYSDGKLIISGAGFGDVVGHDWGEVASAIGAAISALDGGVAAAAGKVLTGVTQTDGRLTGKTEVAYETIAPVRSVSGSGKIAVSPTTGAVVVSHAGAAPSVTNDSAPAGNADRVVTAVTADGTGHVTAVRTKPLSNMVSGSGLTADTVLLGAGGAGARTSGKTIGTAVTGSDAVIPTANAVKSYVDGLLANLSQALTYKGTIGPTGATVTTLPASHQVGWVYVAAAAGAYAGKACEVGDTIICVKAGTTANDAHWTVVNGENQVSNGNPSLAMDGGSYTVATVDGVNITLRTPSLDLATVGGEGKMIQSVAQHDGRLAAVAVDAPVNTDNTALTNGSVTVSKASGAGVTVTGGANKITFSDGAHSFDVPISVSVSHPNGIGKIVVPAQSAAATDVAGNTAATTIRAGASDDAVTLGSGNRWLQLKGDAAGKKVTIGHKVSAIGGGGALRKISYDEAGHVTASSPVTAAEVTIATTPANTASSSNDSAMSISVGGVAGAAITQPIHTDLLRNGNLTLVLNGNF